MPAKVILKVLSGELGDSELVYDESLPIILGRARDCMPTVPNDKTYGTISRHHCMFDINPPNIRVRDMGSLNGTYVNGKSIGRRAAGQTPEEGRQAEYAEHDLKHGDQIGLGRRREAPLSFEVSIEQYYECDRCGKRLEDDIAAQCEREPGYLVCPECWPQEPTAPPPRKKDMGGPFDSFISSGSMEDVYEIEAPPQASAKGRFCACCNADVTHEAEGLGMGAYVCMECRENPRQIMHLLIDKANREELADLGSLKGYRLLDVIGSGGQGFVHLAEKIETGERVAIKMMLPQCVLNRRAQEKFVTEASNMLAFNHPNAVRVFSFGAYAGSFFYTMEYCEGGSADRLQKKMGGTLPVEIASHIILQTLDGLEAAASTPIKVVGKDGKVLAVHGLVHRDLKPQNIFLCGDEARPTAKIGDFGLAKAFESAGLAGYTRTGQMAGSPWFMARQQAVNYKYSKPEVDVYGAAASMYYMLTRQFPKDFPQGADPWRIVIEAKPVPILKRDPAISRKLAAVLDKALDDSKELAFKTAADLKAALQEAL